MKPAALQADAQALVRSAHRRWQEASSTGVLLAVVLTVLILLVVLPLVFLIYGSFQIPVRGSLDDQFSTVNYINVFGDRSTYLALSNSLVYALGHTVLAVTSGTLLAWVAERTNTPGRRFIYLLAIAPLAVPGLLNTIAWIFLLSPRIGLINLLFMNMFGLSEAPFNIFSVYGMMFESGLHWSPFVFLLMGAAFRSLDPALEEAAYTSGATQRQALTRITLPLVGPALFSSILIMFVQALSLLETPLVLGVPANYYVLTSEIFLKMQDMPPNHGLSATLALLLTAIAMIGVYFYNRMTRVATRFATITGKGYRPRLMDLGPWKYLTAAFVWMYFLLVLILPAGVVFWFSLFPTAPSFSRSELARMSFGSYVEVLSRPHVMEALRNSTVLALSSAVLVMLLTITVAWLVYRSRVSGRGLLDGLVSIPLTIPGVVLATALIWTYSKLPIPIYGTMIILLVAYVTKFMPYGMRFASSALVQIHPELEDAARISGASWGRTLTRIILPLLRPAMLGGGIYVILLSIKEFATSLVLWTPGNEVISVLFWELWRHGLLSQLAAYGTVFIAGLVVLVILFEKLGRRFGIQLD